MRKKEETENPPTNERVTNKAIEMWQRYNCSVSVIRYQAHDWGRVSSYDMQLVMRWDAGLWERRDAAEEISMLIDR